MQTVVEIPSYLAAAERLFSPDERAAIVDRLAADPTCGVVIPRSGGIRKCGLASVRAERAGARELFIRSVGKVCLCLFWRFSPKTRRPICRRRSAMRWE